MARSFPLLGHTVIMEASGVVFIYSLFALDIFHLLSTATCMNISHIMLCYLLQHCLHCKAVNLTDWTEFIYRETALQLLIYRVFANELARRSIRSAFFPTLRKECLLFNMENRTLYSQCKHQCDVAAVVSWG